MVRGESKQTGPFVTATGSSFQFNSGKRFKVTFSGLLCLEALFSRYAQAHRTPTSVTACTACCHEILSQKWQDKLKEMYQTLFEQCKVHKNDLDSQFCPCTMSSSSCFGRKRHMHCSPQHTWLPSSLAALRKSSSI